MNEPMSLVTSQPRSPRDNQDVYAHDSPSSPDSSFFDKPLPQQTLSQPSRIHVTWDNIQLQINDNTPEKIPKNEIYKIPIMEIPRDSIQKNDEIDDIIRELAHQSHKLQTSPVNSDDEYEISPNPFLMEDVSRNAVEIDDASTMKITEEETPSPLTYSSTSSPEIQSEAASDVEIDISPIPIKKAFFPELESPKSISSIKEEKAKSEPVSVFLAQPKNVVVYQEHIKPTTEEVLRMLDNFETQNVIPSSEQSMYIEQYLERNRVKCISEGNYLEAEKFDNRAKNLRQKVTENLKTDQSSDKLILYNSKLDDAQKEYLFDKKSCETRYNIMKKECYKKIEEFDKKQERDLQKFDNKWDDPNFLRTYSKPSKDLIQLRKIERKLVLLKRYEEASKIREKADLLEEEETEKNQQRGLEEMVRQRNQLVEKQHEERENYIKKLKSQLMEEKKKNEEIFQKHEKEIARIEQMIEGAKKIQPQWKPRPESKVTTPRTVTRLIKFKKESYFKPLKIKPMRSLSRKIEKKKVIVGSQKPDFEI